MSVVLGNRAFGRLLASGAEVRRASVQRKSAIAPDRPVTPASDRDTVQRGLTDWLGYGGDIVEGEGDIYPERTGESDNWGSWDSKEEAPQTMMDEDAPLLLSLKRIEITLIEAQQPPQGKVEGHTTPNVEGSIQELKANMEGMEGKYEVKTYLPLFEVVVQSLRVIPND